MALCYPRAEVFDMKDFKISGIAFITGVRGSVAVLLSPLATPGDSSSVMLLSPATWLGPFQIVRPFIVCPSPRLIPHLTRLSAFMATLKSGCGTLISTEASIYLSDIAFFLSVSDDFKKF